jgi:hypothetical protein
MRPTTGSSGRFAAWCAAAAVLLAAGCGSAAGTPHTALAAASPAPPSLSASASTAAATPSDSPTIEPSAPASSPDPTTAAPAEPPPAAATAPQPVAACAPVAGFDCDFAARIAAAQAYATTRPGSVGIVLRDRVTGAVWRNADAGTLVWTASTTKLAMAADLLEHDRGGSIHLSDADNADIQAMLHSSDDDAADRLWAEYTGDGYTFYNNRFTDVYGMVGLTPVTRYSDGEPYWGFQKCTPDDLDALMQYVLTRLDPTDTAFIVDQMRNVDSDEQWGVWAAGPAASPGVKDGWSDEDTGWVIDTVGFAGPDERYTVAIMNSLNGDGGYDDGTATVSEVTRILLAGRF